MAEVADAATGARAAAERAGRSPDELRIVVRATVFLGSEAASGRAPCNGSLGQIRSDIEQMHDAGATEVFLDFTFDPRIVGPDADPADMSIILEGELWVVLEDGSETRPAPGSCVVLRGNRHSWVNRSAEPAVMASVFMGVRAR
ncbi:hypothetical protein [Streptomyces sp. NPDC049813]|uniref:hypothetical protein n=1 Tax=Streptomyces sp. NPDC049813 TaxID=3365597 RepID=UPI0037B78868